jgi:SAM-dependent methyltransferase
VGEKWRPFWQQERFSWFAPDRITFSELVRHGRTDWIQRILRATRVQPGKARVLEAGCGTAMFALSLASLGFDVTAFDYNLEALQYGWIFKERLLQAQPHAQIKLYQDNLLAISAAADSFDLTFNQAVLEYFVDASERRTALCEMVRVTRPGGYVAIIVQHTGHPLGGYWRAVGWPGYVNQPPVFRCTPKSLAGELRGVGLTGISTDGIEPWNVLFWYPRWHERWHVTSQLAYLTGRALRKIPLPLKLRSQMALQFLVVGQKPCA